jgi:hypothetical protein
LRRSCWIRSALQKHVWRANIILATADACGTAEIMRRSGKSKPVVTGAYSLAEVLMRHASNFNPEWGYIAPAPNFLRTARVFVVAAAIGAMASAAVVFSLMDRPVAETSVAARTLVQPVEPAPPMRNAPLVGQLQTQSGQTSVLQTERADAAGAMRPQGAAMVAYAGAGSRAGAASTTQRQPIADALVEAPRIMTTEAPPARVLASEPNTAAAPEAAPVATAAAAPTPAPRVVIKKPRAVTRAAAPPRYDVPRYAAPRYEPRYDSMERGPYAFLRQYGSYGQEY